MEELAGVAPSFREKVGAALFRMYPLMSGCGSLSDSRLSDLFLRREGPPVWARAWDRACLAPVDDLVGRSAFLAGDLDPKVSGALRRFVRPGDTVLDIGANIGLMTLLLARLVGPGGRVHSFEPSPRVLPFLEATLAANAGLPCTLHPIALGKERGTLHLHVPPDNAGAATLVPSMARAASTAHEIDVRRLDDVLDAKEIASISAVKIDVEGFEHAVLEGAFDADGPFRPRMIQFEDHGGRDSAVKRLLASQGYRLFGLPKVLLKFSMVGEDVAAFEACNDYVALLDDDAA